MSKYYLRIADVSIEIDCVYDIDLKSDRAYQPFIETNSCSVDGRIRITGTQLSKTSLETVYEGNKGNDTITMHKTNCGFFFQRIRNQCVIMACCLYEDGQQVDAYIYPDLSKDEIHSLIYTIISIGFRYLCLYHKALPIHASAVVSEGKAVLSLGVSGRGKSTHSNMWLKAFPDTELLNDDLPIIRIKDGIVYAYGSPWSGKTPCYKNEKYPVKALLQINRGSGNELMKANNLRKIAIIKPCFFIVGSWTSAIKIINETIGAIARIIDVYDLFCVPDVSAALYVRPLIFRK